LFKTQQVTPLYGIEIGREVITTYTEHSQLELMHRGSQCNLSSFLMLSGSMSP